MPSPSRAHPNKTRAVHVQNEKLGTSAIHDHGLAPAASTAAFHRHEWAASTN